MHTVAIFSPEGEPFQVPKPRVFALLAQGWSLTEPKKKKVEPEARVERITKDAPTKEKDSDKKTAAVEEK